MFQNQFKQIRNLQIYSLKAKNNSYIYKLNFSTQIFSMKPPQYLKNIKTMLAVSAIWAFALLIVFFGMNCRNNSRIISLGVQDITISSIRTGKYTEVYFKYELPLSEGKHITLESKNSASGYYYKKYEFEVGDVIREEVRIIQSGNCFYLDNINLSEYEK